MQMFKRTFAIALLMSIAIQESTASDGRGVLKELPPMNVARAGHTLTTLNDGSVLVVGGFTTEENQIANVELFDPEQRRFQVIDNAITPRQSHTASMLQDGRVLIAGGYNAGAKYLDTTEIYDPATRRFAPAGRMTIPRAGHLAVTLDDGL